MFLDLISLCRGVIIYLYHFTASSTPGSANVRLCVTFRVQTDSLSWASSAVLTDPRHRQSHFVDFLELIDADWMFSPP